MNLELVQVMQRVCDSDVSDGSQGGKCVSISIDNGISPEKLPMVHRFNVPHATTVTDTASNTSE